MPARIAALLRTEEDQGPIKNKLTGIIPTLVRLLEHDRRVETAYLCHEDTMQVCKLSGEGNHFCGYRNIQMLMSLFPRGGKLHSIPELQEMIEKAWDLGYNPHGRVETGGVRGTRKHIGTSEVLKRPSPSPESAQMKTKIHRLTHCSLDFRLRHFSKVKTFPAQLKHLRKRTRGRSSWTR